MTPDIDKTVHGQAYTPTNLLEKIKRFLSTQNGKALSRLLAKSNSSDIGEIMENDLSKKETLVCFSYLHIGQAAQVLTQLEEDLQEACLQSLPDMMGGKILRRMPADEAVDILQEIDSAQSRKLISEMPLDEDTRAIQELLLEEPDTAAGIMSTDFVQCDINGSVYDALTQIRQAEAKDFVYYCYLTAPSTNELQGVISLKQLVIHNDNVPLLDIATTDVKHLLLHYDQALVANLFRKYDNLLAVPVVDEANRLRGTITVDDIIEVIEEETSEELYRASGINIEEMDEKHLITGPAILAVKARIPWLSISVFGHLFASFIIASFETTIQSAVIAMSFMPLLTGLAGNMGTQSDTITVRGLSQSLITPENVRAKLWREMKVALITGGIFACAVGFFSFFVYHKLALTILLSCWIILSLVTTAALGIILPYSYSHFLKKDPAGVGGPFITTMSDILTFSLYLYILTLFLPMMAD